MFTLVQFALTHPLTLYRITRSTDLGIAHDKESPHPNQNGGGGEGGAAAGEFFQLPRSLIEQPHVMLINFAYPGGDEDLALAETQIFRPLFAYRQQVARRRVIQRLVDQK